MAIITVRVSDELKQTMESLNEINWSAVIRNLLEEKVEEIQIRERIAKAEIQIKKGQTISHDEVRKKFAK